MKVMLKLVYSIAAQVLCFILIQGLIVNEYANPFFSVYRQGVIQPCHIGEDGKPQPVEHILQLTENIKLKDGKKD